MPSKNETLAEKERNRRIYEMRVEEQLRSNVSPKLRLLIRDLKIAILDFDTGGVVKLSSRIAKTNKLVKYAEKLIQKYYSKMFDVSLKDSKDLAWALSSIAFKDLKDTTGIDFPKRFTKKGINKSVEKMLVLGAPIKEHWERSAGNFLEKFADEMRIGAVNGEDTSEILLRIDNPRRSVSDLNKMTKRAIKSLVRTTTNAVSSEAKRSIWSEYDEVVSGIQQISTFDSKTTQTCIAYAGAVWDAKTKEPIGHSLPYNGGTPRHRNCRSTEVAVLNEEKYGAPSEDVGFDSWLGKKSDKFQDELLGKGKAGLWREDKISLTDLLDQKGRPMTLEELGNKFN